ncbi:hypothetical protein ACTFIY_008032 [Dictyostelium cf. discoideum]
MKKILYNLTKKKLFPLNNYNKNNNNNISKKIEFKNINIQEFINGCRKIIINRDESSNSINSEISTNFLLNKLNEYKDDKESKFLILCGDNTLPNSISLINKFNKPTISFVNETTMGLTLHCSHRIVGDNANWSIPKNKNLIFSDFGISHFLSRLGSVGLYLGIGRSTIKTTDLIKTNIANNYIPNESFDKALCELCINPMVNGNDEIDFIIRKYKKELIIDRESSDLVKYRDIINRCFNRNFKSVQEIISHLKNEILFDDIPHEKQWAINTLSILENSCQTSLSVSFENIQNSLYLNINEVFDNENKIIKKIGKTKEFPKLFNNKTQKQIQSPSSINEISQTI